MNSNDQVNIKKNIAYQMLYEVLAIALPLITTPYISRVLGAENLGIYSYAYSIATYYGMFAMLGVKNHGNREIAKCRGDQEKINRTFTNIYVIQFGASVLSLAVYLGFVFTSDSAYRLYYFIDTLYVISCMLDINWFFVGIERIKLTVLRNTLIKVAGFIATLLFVKSPTDLWKYCLIVVLSSLLSQLVLWTYFPRYARLERPQKAEIKKNIKPVLILFIPAIAISIYNVMDKIMVGALSEKTQLGYYESAEKIINCVKTIPISVGTVMLPRMSRLVAEKDVAKSRRYLLYSIELVMFITCALSFGISCVANDFAIVYLGEEFAACGTIMIGLAMSLLFSGFANVIRTQYLIPNSMDQQYIIAVISGAVVNTIINALLIPNYGAMGATIGTIFAEGAVCLIQCFFVRKYVELGLYFKKTMVFVAIGLVMSLGVALINLTPISSLLVRLIVKIAVGAMIYLTLSCIYFISTKNEVFLDFIKGRRHKKEEGKEFK